ncbi:hypothetical protein [Pseudomonas putida]|uniref:hypothetical protein n=1 Tax=Pseudomonas putida TaxID=303 RepID=UPI0039FC5C70
MAAAVTATAVATTAAASATTTVAATTAAASAATTVATTAAASAVATTTTTAIFGVGAGAMRNRVRDQYNGRRQHASHGNRQ